MLLVVSLVLGSIAWCAIKEWVLQRFDIFTTIGGIFGSWAVVCMIVYNILDGIF